MDHTFILSINEHHKDAHRIFFHSLRHLLDKDINSSF